MRSILSKNVPMNNIILLHTLGCFILSKLCFLAANTPIMDRLPLTTYPQYNFEHYMLYNVDLRSLKVTIFQMRSKMSKKIPHLYLHWHLKNSLHLKSKQQGQGLLSIKAFRFLGNITSFKKPM